MMDLAKAKKRHPFQRLSSVLKAKLRSGTPWKILRRNLYTNLKITEI